MNPERKRNYRIVGVNLLVMVIYTILCRVINKSDGFILVAILVGLHSLFCFITGIVNVFIDRYRQLAGMWSLSALAVLLLGFSTCMAVYTVKI